MTDCVSHEVLSMKIQDLMFISVVLALLVIQKSKWFLYMGLACFALAIPLFAKWIFFTGERLTWYGAGFLLIAVIIQVFQVHKVESS